MNASRAFITTFTEKALVPSELYNWDDYNYRMLRYALGEAYYSNISYSSIASFSTRLKIDKNLYKHLRSIYNPVNRLVEFYVGAVYGGELDFEEMTNGAMPILMADDALKEAIRQTWKWSNWRSQKNVYVRQGSTLGDVGLWVVDEPDRQKVRIEVLHPGKIKETECDGVGNVKRAVIEYEIDEEQNGKITGTYVKRIEVDKERFATFKDGEPFAFYNDARGNPIAEWVNEYGFVPLVTPKHKDMGLRWGASPFHAQYPLIDEMNDAASILNDAVRKSVNIMWYFAGAQSSEDLRPGTGVDPTTEKSRRDTFPAIYGPENSQPHAMVPNIDISAAGANLDRMIQEMERNNPELSLHRLRDGGNLTAPGVRTAYTDALNKAKEAQGNYDDGYIRAQQMAISIGGYRGYEGFESFSLDSYDKGDLQFYIKPRPVIGDSLSKQERVTAFVSVGSAPLPIQRLILRELDVDEKDIEEIITEQQAEKQANMQQAAAIAGNEPATGGEGEQPSQPAANGQSAPQQSAQSNAQRTLAAVFADLDRMTA